MRYRRLSYRYTSVTQHAVMWPVPLWPREGLGGTFGQQQWRPDADMFESAGTIDIVVDLAGMEEDGIEVQLFDDALVVEGKRQLDAFEESVVFHAAGVRKGPFRLELPLPGPVDPGGVDARYERGLLRLTLRKRTGR